MWEPLLWNRDVLLFGDNDSATAGFVRGGSPVDDSREFVVATRVHLAKLAPAPWFCSVPSPSNIADAPSRGDWAVLVKEGAKRALIAVPPSLANIVQVRELR